jgi:hypothetical protein
MKLGPVLVFPPSTDVPVERENVRADQPLPHPAPGNQSTAGKVNPVTNVSTPAIAQDEVKLQWNSQYQVETYQFLDHRGELIMQIPSEQMLNLAHEISQELLREAAPHTAAAGRGGKSYGR